MKFLVVLLSLVLIGVDCENPKDLLIEQQQEQISQLLSTIEKQTSSTEMLQQRMAELEDSLKEANKKPVVQSAPPQTTKIIYESSELKLEKCKSLAEVAAKKEENRVFEINYDDPEIKRRMTNPLSDEERKQNKAFVGVLDFVYDQEYKKVYSECLNK